MVRISLVSWWKWLAFKFIQVQWALPPNVSHHLHFKWRLPLHSSCFLTTSYTGIICVQLSFPWYIAGFIHNKFILSLFLLVSRCQSHVWWQCLLDLDNKLEGQPPSSPHSALDTSVQVRSNALLCIGLIHMGLLEDLNINVFNMIAHNLLDLDSELEGQPLSSSHSALDTSVHVNLNALLCIGFIHIGPLEGINLNIFNVIAYNLWLSVNSKPMKFNNYNMSPNTWLAGIHLPLCFLADASIFCHLLDCFYFLPSPSNWSPLFSLRFFDFCQRTSNYCNMDLLAHAHLAFTCGNLLCVHESRLLQCLFQSKLQNVCDWPLIVAIV